MGSRSRQSTMFTSTFPPEQELRVIFLRDEDPQRIPFPVCRARRRDDAVPHAGEGVRIPAEYQLSNHAARSHCGCLLSISRFHLARGLRDGGLEIYSENGDRGICRPRQRTLSRQQDRALERSLPLAGAEISVRFPLRASPCE